MNFIYTITIKGSTNTIEFKKNAITGVELAYNSRDDSQDRDKNGRTEIIIKGKYDMMSDTLYAIDALSKWARSDEDVFREVTIVATTENNTNEGKTNISRTYHFDNMFCIDYFERTGLCLKTDTKASLEFELFIAQAPNFTIDETVSEVLG